METLLRSSKRTEQIESGSWEFLRISVYIKLVVEILQKGYKPDPIPKNHPVGARPDARQSIKENTSPMTVKSRKQCAVIR